MGDRRRRHPLRRRPALRGPRARASPGSTLPGGQSHPRSVRGLPPPRRPAVRADLRPLVEVRGHPRPSFETPRTRRVTPDQRCDSWDDAFHAPTATAPTSCPATGRPRRGRARRRPAEIGAGRRGGHRPTGAARSSRSTATSARCTLEDRRGERRTFPLGPGFLLEGRPVILRRPGARPAPGGAHAHRVRLGRRRTTRRARVARASRIFVEGRHDAELVEKVWGDDLRIEGVVVEYLDGVDDLAEHLRDFEPGPGAAGRRARRPPGAGLEGEPHRRRRRAVARRRARAGRRPPVRRRLAGGQARAARPRARGPTSRATIEWKHGICQHARLAAPRPGRHRPRLEAHPRRGSRRTPTSSRRCSAGSRS